MRHPTTVAGVQSRAFCGITRTGGAIRAQALAILPTPRRAPYTAAVAASPPDDDFWEPIREQYPPVLTTGQVGELLNIGPRTVLAMAADGRLKASRLPGTRQYNFFREDVIRVLDQNMVRPGEMDLDEPIEEPVAPVRPKKSSPPVRRRRG